MVRHWIAGHATTNHVLRMGTIRGPKLPERVVPYNSENLQLATCKLQPVQNGQFTPPARNTAPFMSNVAWRPPLLNEAVPRGMYWALM